MDRIFRSESVGGYRNQALADVCIWFRSDSHPCLERTIMMIKNWFHRNPLKWIDATSFEVGGNRITMDYAHGGSKRASVNNNFTIMKSREFLTHYLELVGGNYKKVLELGVYQGGSFVFLDGILRPDKISAIEISDVPIPALDGYVAKNKGRAIVHYCTSQDDVAALQRIVADDFNGELDLVVDDASHFYEPSRVSFQTLFPKLRPGGMYIIEDWTWSFQAQFQGEDAPWTKQNSLANLVIDLMEEMAVAPLIENIEICSPLIKIRRSSEKLRGPATVLTQTARRGREIGLL